MRPADTMISGESGETGTEHSTLRTSVEVAGESPVGMLQFPSPIQPHLAA